MNTKKVAAGLAAVVGIGAAAFGALALKPASAQLPPPRPLPPVQRHRGDGDHDRDDRRRGERHPEIQRALTNLRQAQNNLQHAAHDFGGHRERALDLVQQAISQCNQALQADRR